MRRFTRIAVPLLFFCVGGAVGAWVSIEHRASVFAAGVEQRLAGPAPGFSSQISQTTNPFASSEDLLSAIMSAVAEDEPLLRAHRLHTLLGGLGSAEFGLLFERTVQVENRERRALLLRALLTRWAVVDLPAAEAAVRPYRDKWRQRAAGFNWQSLESAVAQAWSQARPEAALAEAMASPDTLWAWYTAHAAMQSLGDGDPARQLDLLAQLPPNSFRNAHCANALKALAEHDPAAAEARLDLLTEPRSRARLQAEILGKTTERDPAAGLARLVALAPDLKVGSSGLRMVSQVMRSAAMRDAGAALRAVDELPEALQEQAVGAALVGWASEHPVDALAYAAANDITISEASAPMSMGDNFFGQQSLIHVALATDRAKTLAWLRTQPASAERDALLRAGLDGFAMDDAFEVYEQLSPRAKESATGNVVVSALRGGEDSAVRWIQSLPPGGARTNAIKTFALIRSGSESEKIDAIGEQWPPGPDRDAALNGIVTSIAQSDPRRAVSFARRVSDPPIRESTFERIAQTWLFTDRSSARAWLASTPDLSAEQKRVLLRQAEER